MKSQNPSYKYEPADRWFVLNDRDPHLKPIYISLPEPPPLETIDGYGLPPEEQRFKRLEYPPRLKALEDEVMRDLRRKETISRDFKMNGYTIYEEFWKRLDSKCMEYKQEIKFIKRVWWHRVNGYWFFNRGKPTYLTNWNFTYLNYFYLGEAGQYPDYRDRDRRWFLAQKYCFECTEVFRDLDGRGKARKVDGGYRMEDTGRRQFLGTANTKGRRIGDTSKAFVPYHEMGVISRGAICGIISFGGESADAAFKKKFVPAWQRMPVWMKPIYANSSRPSVINYDIPRTVFGMEGMGTTLDYATSGGEKSYDSKRVRYLICDEEGKHDRIDVMDRWETLKYCLMVGEKLVGYSIHPTTVEEMESGGGDAFFKLMKAADFYSRLKDSGRTRNLLMGIFFRASDGMDGAIDSYGYSVEFEPTDWQRAEGFTDGIFNIIERRREQLMKSGSPEDMRLYRQNQRKQPIYYMDSFVDEAGGLGFDYVRLGEAKMRLKERTKAVRYNIQRDPSNFDGPRRLVPDEDGKFYVSIDLPYHRMNQKVRMMEYDHVLGRDEWTWRPKDMTWAMAGADPVTYMKRREGMNRQSKAGGCIVWNRDHQVDQGVDPTEWMSYRTVVTYLHQPSTVEEYGDDMLDMCLLFSVPMYTENNRTELWEHFDRRGYGGFLVYDIDPSTGKKRSRPGVNLNVGTKQKGFGLVTDYIKQRIHHEEHLELVEQMDTIKGIDELTKYDLLSAFICALLGLQGSYAEMLQTFGEEEEVDVMDLMNL